MAVTSSTGCAGNNAVGKGEGIRFDSLEHKALEDADLLEGSPDSGDHGGTGS